MRATARPRDSRTGAPIPHSASGGSLSGESAGGVAISASPAPLRGDLVLTLPLAGKRIVSPFARQVDWLGHAFRVVGGK